MFLFQKVKPVGSLPATGAVPSLSDGASCSLFSLDSSQYVLFPGFCDVHVHFREPGFSYKETIRSGSMAAARGGYTDVCTMPNLDPVPDSLEHLRPQLEAISRDGVIGIHPYGALTVGEKGLQLAALEELAPYAAAFSDDGKGVQQEELMRSAMLEAKALGKVIAAHCEDERLLRGGYIHDGDYCRAHGHKGIVSESEWGAVKRDLELVRETGVSYHVCHVSAKETVELIRRAKAEGLDVTCETAPHYLLLDDSMLEEDGRFKMNPPIRDKSDRDALIEGVKDGTVDMIVTDHAPHTEEEKSRGLAGSPMGIVGLETSFPLLYTYLVLPGIVTLPRLIELMSENPRRRFGIPTRDDDFTLFDLGARYKIDPADFLSKGKSTPFAGWEVAGKCRLTVCRGQVAYLDPETKARNE